jgi:ABC-type sugar transport system substrate-binding protein
MRTWRRLFLYCSAGRQGRQLKALFKRVFARYPQLMGIEQTGQQPGEDDRMVSAAAVTAMLANLQEAVITADTDSRRALLKGVIAQLQEVLTGGSPH